jgi:hypothetical protein
MNGNTHPVFVAGTGPKPGTRNRINARGSDSDDR